MLVLQDKIVSAASTLGLLVYLVLPFEVAVSEGAPEKV
jgi:hypothetical protein